MQRIHYLREILAWRDVAVLRACFVCVAYSFGARSLLLPTQPPKSKLTTPLIAFLFFFGGEERERERLSGTSLSLSSSFACFNTIAISTF